MKIKKIEILNFKVFQNITIDFETSDLIVFDGPNGFGKTSVYDAIELLFTGKIRRFNDLKTKLIDGRESFSEHPFLCDYADGDISITIEFLKDNSLYTLKREAKREELTNSIDFSLYKLYRKDNFDSKEYFLIENEEEYFNEILGLDYKENFQFLNYIEQEDSLFLLKNQDKYRKQHISHLFNVAEFEGKIIKIDKLKNKISVLCSNEKQIEIDNLEETIQKIENFLATEFGSTQFTRLFSNKNIPWDLEEFNFQSYTYENIFAEEGIITKLKKLITNKESFKKYLRNEKINILIQDKQKLDNFLMFYHFLPYKESLKEQKNEIEKIIKIIQNLNDLSIENIKESSFTINLKDFYYINPDIISIFERDYNALQGITKELDHIESIYSKIEETRSKLADNIKSLKDEEDEVLKGTCFLCGYNWDNFDDLLNQIETQSIQLKELTSSKSKHFSEELAKFKSTIVSQIIKTFNDKINEIKIDLNFVNNLLSIEDVTFNTTKKELESIDFNYEEHLNKILSTNNTIDIDNLIIPKLSSLKIDIELSTIEFYFKEIFAQYFDNSFESLELLSLDNILQKENYLKYKYSMLQNENLEKKKQELLNKKNKFNNAKTLESNLKNLNTIYKNSLKEYQKKVIKDIEIIFHIYSGRIMQDFQGGLGLFIYSDKDGIRFQVNPSKTFDAVFSMSSGQLSALIISFTLALHKKYSKNKIILIDDPIQTMDEINIVGFIELLRNEFHSNQIIVSTHEDMASTFMRYKFKSYGLLQKRINLKMYQN